MAEAHERPSFAALLTKFPSFDPTWSLPAIDGWMRCFTQLKELAEAEDRGAGMALPHEAKQALRSGFMFGWKAAAVWANRGDLIADIGSPAYEKDCDAACGVEGLDSKVKQRSAADGLPGAAQ